MAKQSQSWKALERKVAKVLGGRRNYRGADFSKSSCDIVCDTWIPECKYRTRLPKIYREESTNSLVIQHKERVFLSFDLLSLCIKRVSSHVSHVHFSGFHKKYSKFYEDALQQAISYDTMKVPLVIVKQKGERGEWVYMRLADLETILSYEKQK